MKSIFIKLLIALPIIYLALFAGLWSSVTDSRPILNQSYRYDEIR
ncbi:MAG: hypothetical protein O3A64_04450 [Proteobacteria bacterium]|nr:hypothetical protein [Pseudomonadota bacterium]